MTRTKWNTGYLVGFNAIETIRWAKVPCTPDFMVIRHKDRKDTCIYDKGSVCFTREEALKELLKDLTDSETRIRQKLGEYTWARSHAESELKDVLHRKQLAQKELKAIKENSNEHRRGS